METSWKLPGFTKSWPRCLNLIVAYALQSQRTCEAVAYACWHLPHPGFPTSCSLNRCQFKWWCPVSGPISILSWFWLQLSNSQADFAEGLLRNSLGFLWPQVCTASAPNVSCLSTPWFLPREPLYSSSTGKLRLYEWMWEALSGYLVGCFISINSHVSWHLYQLHSFMICQFYHGLMAVLD
jgi:hypothetical protein